MITLVRHVLSGTVHGGGAYGIRRTLCGERIVIGGKRPRWVIGRLTDDPIYVTCRWCHRIAAATEKRKGSDA